MIRDYDFIIAGGGLGGSACLERLRSGDKSVLLIEKENTLGGLVRTTFKDGYLIDHGPTVFLKSYEYIWDLLDKIGLANEVLFNDTKSTERFICLNNTLHPVPEGPISLAKTSILSAHAKVRLFCEPFIKKGNNHTETVREFGYRRLGKELTDNIMDAVISGICAGDIDQLEINSLYPKLFDIESRYRSLLVFLFSFKRKNIAHVPKKKGIRFGSFIRGMGSIAAKILERNIDHVLLNTEIKQINFDNNKYIVTTTNGTYTCNHIVLATPAYTTAKLIHNISQELSRLLSLIPYINIATVSLGFRQTDVTHPAKGFGFLIPRNQNKRILGTLFSSSIFNGRAPEGHILTTTYIGGAHDPDILNLKEDMIADIVTNELKPLLGLINNPVFSHVRKIPFAIPQYNRGHYELKNEIVNLANKLPGLTLAGNYLHGISVNEAIRSAMEIKL